MQLRRHDFRPQHAFLRLLSVGQPIAGELQDVCQGGSAAVLARVSRLMALTSSAGNSLGKALDTGQKATQDARVGA